MEKHRNFSLALSIREPKSLAHGAGVGLDDDPDDSTDVDNNEDDDGDFGAGQNAPGFPHSSSQPNLFSRATWLARNTSPLTPLPLRTQQTDTTAFQLNYCPNILSATVEEVASMFRLPDLRPALANYIHRARDLCAPTLKIGQRCSSPLDAELLFTHLQVWHSVRMQMQTSDAEGVTDPQRVSAAPPSSDWPFGRYDTVLISNGAEPGPGLGGTVFYPSPTINKSNAISRVRRRTDPVDLPPSVVYGYDPHIR
jgi:hypothetical protein